GVALLGAVTLPAAGQGTLFTPYPPLKWLAEESRFSHADAHDEGRDILYWFEEGEEDQFHWIYVTGFVTEMDGNTVLGTRFATFKYDATHAGPSAPTAADEAFFPSLTQFESGDTYKAVAMAVDPLTGDIYVTGEAPWKAGATAPTADQNYAIVKYDKDLTQQWVTYYEGPASGDDIPADIIFDASSGVEYVVVTGTSPGSGTGKDIATIALRADTGAFASTAWPNAGHGGGVRRYNGDEDGDDSAVELSPI